MENKYPHQDLSYKLIGCGYKVYNSLKFGYQEKYYQRAYALELEEGKISYSREHKIVIDYKGKKIGRYFLDFLIEDSVVVELKIASDFHPKHISQVLAYMRAKNVKMGLILLFTKHQLRIKRLIV